MMELRDIGRYIAHPYVALPASIGTGALLGMGVERVFADPKERDLPGAAIAGGVTTGVLYLAGNQLAQMYQVAKLSNPDLFK